MKKILYLTGLLIISTFFFAVTLCASNQFKTSISPYSWQRISSDNVEHETENTDYGLGIKFSYLYTRNNGLSFGFETGMLDYYLSDKATIPNVNGNCVVYPIFFKIGYYTPKIKEKNVKYFVLADLGVRVLHVTYENNANASFGAELGFNVNLGKGFLLGMSVEPEWAFSEKKKKTSKDGYTDFIVSGNIGLMYEW